MLRGSARSGAAFVVALLLVGLAAPTAANAAPTVDVVNVVDHGANGTDQADDSAAFQAAIAQSRTLRRPVYVPYGTYRIAQELVLQDQLLFGEPAGAWGSDGATLPTIVPTNNAVTAFRLEAGGAVSGLNIVHPRERANDYTTGAATIMLNGVGTRVSTVRIHGAYTGIDVPTRTGNNIGRSEIENVFISRPVDLGIRLNYGFDAISLDNVVVWSFPGDYQDHFLRSGRGIMLGHVDALHMNNTFVHGAAHGIQTFRGAEGRPAWATLTNTSVDFAGFEALDITAGAVLTISGGVFWGHRNGVLVHDIGARVNMSAVHLRGNALPALQVEEAGWLTVGSSTIERSDTAHTAPAVQLNHGWNMAITGNHITGHGNGVAIEAGVSRLAMTGNVIEATGTSTRQPLRNAQPSNPQIVVANNVIAG